jgi:hypothetical protein
MDVFVHFPHYLPTACGDWQVQKNYHRIWVAFY